MAQNTRYNADKNVAKLRVGVICPSEIAFRRFMPALCKTEEAEFVGLGISSREERFGGEDAPESLINEILKQERSKAENFVGQYGGKVFESYADVVDSTDIDAVYIPLPPALHYKWAMRALENGKHVLVEKPATVSADDTRRLAELAEKKGLALHENYMFTFHEQLKAIDDIIMSGELGDIRLYRISFGFPRRSANDFRYDKQLGGGALIDAGGYTLKYANRLLGDTARIKYAQLNYLSEFDVDIYGSAALVNKDGTTAQIAFGMDNQYKCELEVWGSKGTLLTGRVLTAPAGFIPEAVIKKGNEQTTVSLPADDSFANSIRHFLKCIRDDSVRTQNYREICRQAELVSSFIQMAENG